MHFNFFLKTIMNDFWNIYFFLIQSMSQPILRWTRSILTSYRDEEKHGRYQTTHTQFHIPGRFFSTLTNSHTHAHTHAHTYAHSLTHTRTLLCTLNKHTHTHTHTYTHTPHTLSLSYTRVLALFSKIILFCLLKVIRESSF